LNYFLYI